MQPRGSFPRRRLPLGSFRTAAIAWRTPSGLINPPPKKVKTTAGICTRERRQGAAAHVRKGGPSGPPCSGRHDGRLPLRAFHPAQEALSWGTFVVAAADNDGENDDGDVASPASVKRVIAVGAVNQTGVIAPFSSAGQNGGSLFPPILPRTDPDRKPEVVAPGVRIWCDIPGGGHGFGSGTSHATAFVSCAPATIPGARPDLRSQNNGGETTIVKFKQVLMETAPVLDGQAVPHDEHYGYGLIQAYDACVALGRENKTAPPARGIGMPKNDEKTSVTSQERSDSPKIPVVFSGDLDIATKCDTDMVDITSALEALVNDSGVQEGIASVFVPGATGALTTMEFEPGVVEDLRAALRRMVPAGIEYQHHLKWKDGNGHSHVRAALIGPGVTLPVRQGRLPLGTWQQVVFIELDARPRKRKLLVQIIGTR